MQNFRVRPSQRGVALVMGLVLLVVATLIAVVTMQSSTFQERMASNHHNKAVSFMAAEMGAAHILAELNAKGFDPEEDETQWNVGDEGLPLPAGRDGWFWAEIANADPFRIAVFGVSRTQRAPPNLALTELNLEIGVLRTPGPSTAGSPNDAAINLVGNVKEFYAADSNAYKVTGHKEAGQPTGPAVGVSSDEARKDIEDELANMGEVDGECPEGPRLCNYDGGIKKVDFDELFTDAEKMQAFVSAACIEAKDRCGSTPPADTIARGSPSAKAAAMEHKLTVVTGDATGDNKLDFSGGQQGAGLLIVQGNLETKGNPVWDGLIIVLGGTFEVKGGGNGGLNGSIFVLNLNTPSSDDWTVDPDGVTWKTDGGGTAAYNHNCDLVNEALLASFGPYDPLADPPGSLARTLFGDAHGCGPGTATESGGSGSDDASVQYTILNWVEVLR